MTEAENIVKLQKELEDICKAIIASNRILMNLRW